jgi:hypothetical protein
MALMVGITIPGRPRYSTTGDLVACRSATHRAALPGVSDERFEVGLLSAEVARWSRDDLEAFNPDARRNRGVR